jgi:hypothetical protein
MRVSTRSALILGVFIVTMTSANAQWPLGRETSQQPSKIGEADATITITGRFQVFVSPNLKGNTFMIDTETGRIWIMKKDHASGEFSFQRIPVEQVDGQQSGGSVPEKTKEVQKEPTKQK